MWVTCAPPHPPPPPPLQGVNLVCNSGLPVNRAEVVVGAVVSDIPRYETAFCRRRGWALLGPERCRGHINPVGELGEREQDEVDVSHLRTVLNIRRLLYLRDGKLAREPPGRWELQTRGIDGCSKIVVKVLAVGRGTDRKTRKSLPLEASSVTKLIGSPPKPLLKAVRLIEQRMLGARDSPQRKV